MSKFLSNLLAPKIILKEKEKDNNKSNNNNIRNINNKSNINSYNNNITKTISPIIDNNINKIHEDININKCILNSKVDNNSEVDADNNIKIDSSMNTPLKSNNKTIDLTPAKIISKPSISFTSILKSNLSNNNNSNNTAINNIDNITPIINQKSTYSTKFKTPSTIDNNKDISTSLMKRKLSLDDNKEIILTATEDKPKILKHSFLSIVHDNKNTNISSSSKSNIVVSSMSTTSAELPAYCSVLNDMQREAVLAPVGSLLITAAAGSGKTLTLITRIIHHLMNGVRGENILAITFTRKAAEEMRNRIEKIAGWSAASAVQICNFHQLALKILRQNWQSYFKQPFQVLGVTEQIDFIKECVDKEVSIDDPRAKPSVISAGIDELNDFAAERLENLECDKVKVKIRHGKKDKHPVEVYSRYINIIRSAKQKGQNSSHFKEELFHKVFSSYERMLQERSCIDFSDMIPLALDLLERRSDLLDRYSDLYQNIFCDEFQDADKDQFKLLCLLAKDSKKITACGDEDQSIYGWRGSDVQIFNWFRQEFSNYSNIILSQSYRFSNVICKAVNGIISKNKVRTEKTIWTSNDDGALIDVILNLEFQNECESIINKIKELHSSGVSWSKIAVLARTRKIINQLNSCFKKENVPSVHHVSKMVSFSHRSKEITDIISYCELASSLNSDASFNRVYNTPKRGFGASIFTELKALSISNKCSLYESAKYAITIRCRELNPKQKIVVAEFLALIESFNIHFQTHSIGELMRFILDKTKYLDEVPEERKCNVSHLVDLTDQFDNSTSDPLIQYNSFDQTLNSTRMFNYLAHIRKDNIELESEVCFLSTIHQAKGMEWDYVIVAHFNEGTMPVSYGMEGSDGEDSSAMEAIYANILEEERRLCYVACSRARKKLYLSYCQLDCGMPVSPSRFLEEIPTDMISGWIKGQLPLDPAIAIAESTVYFKRASKFFPPTMKLLD